ncbi:hypothetical protein SAMN05444349_108103 [Bacteroides faecichinchillae]|uniref:Uncharacterized protein n=1 Tax=Bacteroides faecichinchillae TaxID=871325 RepID=A0A1M4XJV3_9BACE|nr:hypothetical protein SAMN05444349_108103 [Bacteroides faecichinchillae]
MIYAILCITNDFNDDKKWEDLLIHLPIMD